MPEGAPLEGGFAGHVVHDDGAVGDAIEGGSDVAELLLAGCERERVSKETLENVYIHIYIYI